MQQLTNAIVLQDYAQYFHAGIPFETYVADFSQKLHSDRDFPHKQYLPTNWQRMNRIDRMAISSDLLGLCQSVTTPLKWLVISEHWCGDAAQIVPVLNQVAKASKGRIDMRLVYRDEHLELIDAHLTGKSRSIPKLIQLDNHYQVVATWGPRPAAAQDLVQTLKANPETAGNYAEALHKWYAMDRQQAIQQELMELIRPFT